MEERIACGCGNPVYRPPVGRDYACPLCGRRLPRRLDSGEITSTWPERLARISLALGCLATIFVVVWKFILTPLTRPAAPVGVALIAPRPPLRPAYQERYRIRVRQLEEDLRRDPTEYGVLIKLAVLHTRLGLRQPDPAQRTAELETARGLYEQAAAPGVAIMRREFDFAMFQTERLLGHFPLDDNVSDQAPASDPFSPGWPMGLPYDAEMMLRLRRDYTQVRLRDHPDQARLLCRLGWTCYRLAQAVRQRPATSDSAWFYGGSPSEPDQLMAQAVEILQRAAHRSPTREYRVEAFQGLADIFQTQKRWSDALAMRRKIVTLQPNNWFANYRLNANLRQLGRRAEADRALQAGMSWRTPDWF